MRGWGNNYAGVGNNYAGVGNNYAGVGIIMSEWVTQSLVGGGPCSVL